MPYCTNCGRKLNDGEICSCTAPAQGVSMQQPNNTAPQGGQYNNGGMQQASLPQQGYWQQPYPYNGQPYPNQPYPHDFRYSYDGQALPPPPKPSNKWILAIVIPLAAVFLVLIVLILAIMIPSYSRYKQKAKQTNINSKASSIYRAANSALADLDADGVDVNGDYIISSDSSKDIAVPYDAGKFCERENKYFDKAAESEYFIVVRDGVAVYAAASESWTDKKAKIGTYPARYTGSSVAYSPVEYSPRGENVLAEKGKTLDDLYDHAVKEFKEDIKKQNYKEW
ncbi:proline-rich domain-containing protein [Ruminococcus sp.]|uniref:proline-rich domain-containing protein n=1 Tax=Ruminococcus sp. TaxID=41978 RepID=UPI00260050E3|nr:proline-rich domain-containing protein [Ruminococcus sp.]MCR4639181.1 hypothetical protein [Ruminococcus sp.]